MSAELEMEPIPGLPAELPPGERIVWQGRPSWRALAQQTFKIRWFAAYFAVLVVFRAQSALAKGGGVVTPVLLALLLAGACLGMLTLFAWLHARATVYTLTSRRIVMRFGVTLPMAWNVPFKRIAAAEVSVRGPSDGDVAFELVRPDKIAWLHLWPHVKPGTVSRPRPAFRAISEADHVARLVASTVQAWAEEQRAAVMLGALNEPGSSPETHEPALGEAPKPARGASPASVRSMAVGALAEGVGR
jgi:hypothetical protein